QWLGQVHSIAHSRRALFSLERLGQLLRAASYARAAEPGRLRAFISPESGAGLPEPRCAVVQSHGVRRSRLRTIAVAMAKGEGAVQTGSDFGADGHCSSL